jgi:flagellar FliL protein
MTMSRVILLVLGLNTLIVMGNCVFSFLQWRAGSAAAVHTVEGSGQQSTMTQIEDIAFYPIDKIVLNLAEGNQESYFLLDLSLQTDVKTQPTSFKQIEPLVRNSVVASLSELTAGDLKAMPIRDVQARLEAALVADFSSRNLDVPFLHILVSKLLVQ